MVKPAKLPKAFVHTIQYEWARREHEISRRLTLNIQNEQGACRCGLFYRVRKHRPDVPQPSRMNIRCKCWLFVLVADIPYGGGILHCGLEGEHKILSARESNFVRLCDTDFLEIHTVLLRETSRLCPDLCRKHSGRRNHQRTVRVHAHRRTT